MITIFYPIKHMKIDRIIFVETDESWSTYDEYLLKMISFFDISWFSYKCGIVGLVVVQSDEHQCEFFRWSFKTKRLRISSTINSLVECDWEDSLKCCLLVHMHGNLCTCCLQFYSICRPSQYKMHSTKHTRFFPINQKKTTTKSQYKYRFDESFLFANGANDSRFELFFLVFNSMWINKLWTVNHCHVCSLSDDSIKIINCIQIDAIKSISTSITTNHRHYVYV